MQQYLFWQGFFADYFYQPLLAFQPRTHAANSARKTQPLAQNPTPGNLHRLHAHRAVAVEKFYDLLPIIGKAAAVELPGYGRVADFSFFPAVGHPTQH